MTDRDYSKHIINKVRNDMHANYVWYLTAKKVLHRFHIKWTQ